MAVTYNQNFMAVFGDTSEVTITWNWNRYEIFEIILDGTYRQSLISHSISYMGRCVSTKLEFSQVHLELYCWKFRCYILIIVM